MDVAVMTTYGLLGFSSMSTLHKKSSSQIHIVANVHFCLGLGPSQNPHVCNLRIKSHFN